MNKCINIKYNYKIYTYGFIEHYNIFLLKNCKKIYLNPFIYSKKILLLNICKDFDIQSNNNLFEKMMNEDEDTLYETIHNLNDDNTFKKAWMSNITPDIPIRYKYYMESPLLLKSNSKYNVDNIDIVIIGFNDYVKSDIILTEYTK